MKTPADVFPLVIPCNEAGTAWEGFLILASAGSQRTALWLRLSCPDAAGGTLKDAQLECSPELLDLLEVQHVLLCPSHAQGHAAVVASTTPALHAHVCKGEGGNA